LLSPGRAPELLAVLTHDHGGRLQPNADGTALVDEGALCGDPPDDILRCQYRRHRHHLDMRDPKANNARACARNIQTQRLGRKRLSMRACSLCGVIPNSNSGREQCIWKRQPKIIASLYSVKISVDVS
jgi:hypothetical protein